MQDIHNECKINKVPIRKRYATEVNEYRVKSSRLCFHLPELKPFPPKRSSFCSTIHAKSAAAICKKSSCSSCLPRLSSFSLPPLPSLLATVYASLDFPPGVKKLPGIRLQKRQEGRKGRRVEKEKYEPEGGDRRSSGLTFGAEKPDVQGSG